VYFAVPRRPFSDETFLLRVIGFHPDFRITRQKQQTRERRQPMKTLNTSADTLKFHCVYCGQRMECDPLLGGRQMLCPSCLHRIVIPAPARAFATGRIPAVPDTWDTHVPLPNVMIPSRQGVGQERGQPCPRVSSLQAAARGLSGPRSCEGFQLAPIAQ
jgi:DNA-directed RNA polymerase subunit RPC12/RpoP